MEQLAEQVRQLTDAIRLAPPRVAVSWVPSLIAAFIAAVTSIAATRAAVWFQTRRTEQNVAASLYQEIKFIKAALDNAISSEKRKDYVRIQSLTSPDRVCPLYRGVGPSIGVMPAVIGSKLVSFYTALLTVRPIAVDDKIIADAFKVEEISVISALGGECLRALEAQYSRAMAA